MNERTYVENDLVKELHSVAQKHERHVVVEELPCGVDLLGGGWKAMAGLLGVWAALLDDLWALFVRHFCPSP